MDDKEHYKALRTLETLIVQEEGAIRLLSMTMKIKCQIELREHDDATVTCVKMASMFEQINLENQPTTVMNELHDEIKLLVERFIKINIDSSLFLQRCRFDLIIRFFKEKTRLLKLQNIGFKKQKIAEELMKQNKRIDFKLQYPLVDKILKEMQRIDNVNFKVKCESIAWFLKCYGFCCNKAADYDKSIEIHKQAILLMESTFGDDANQYKVLGHCYNNLGGACENSNKLVEAKRCYDTALNIYNQAKDWTGVQQKVGRILLATDNSQRVKDRIQT